MHAFPNFGIEPNPMASFASRTKVDWDVNPDELIAHAIHVGNLALGKLSDQGIEDQESLPLFGTKQRTAPKGLQILTCGE